MNDEKPPKRITVPIQNGDILVAEIILHFDHAPSKRITLHSIAPGAGFMAGGRNGAFSFTGFAVAEVTEDREQSSDQQ